MSENRYSSFGMVIKPPDDEVAAVGTEKDVDPRVLDFNDTDGRRKHSSVKLEVLLPTPVIRKGMTLDIYVPPRHLDNSAHIALQKDSIEDTFADMVQDAPTARSVPLVVLDCANIGWCYGGDSFSAEGVTIAIQYFRQLQTEVQGFIPASYLRAKPSHAVSSTGNAMMITEDLEILNELAGTSVLSIVPSGDSDDAYILNYARDNNGFVISNDLFNDHLRHISNPSIRSSMFVWLQDHRCGYAFSARREFLFNPSSLLRDAVQEYHDHLWQLQQQQEELKRLQERERQGCTEFADMSLSSRTDGSSGEMASTPLFHPTERPFHPPPEEVHSSTSLTLSLATPAEVQNEAQTGAIAHNGAANTHLLGLIANISHLINQTGELHLAKDPYGNGKGEGEKEHSCGDIYDKELQWLLLTRASFFSKV